MPLTNTLTAAIRVRTGAGQISNQAGGWYDGQTGHIDAIQRKLVPWSTMPNESFERRPNRLRSADETTSGRVVMNPQKSEDRNESRHDPTAEKSRRAVEIEKSIGSTAVQFIH